ncbi:MAG: response regulator [Ignavibacteriales bacterium]|nr:response regulator [Ignavibacteriales bacterium]
MLKNRILLADDDLELGKMLEGELKSFGYNVKAVDDGEKAISELKQSQFDLAILDIRMPKVDGFGKAGSKSNHAYSICRFEALNYVDAGWCRRVLKQTV